MRESCAGVQDGPDVVNYLPMCPHHVKVETIRVLVLEVPQERFAESGRLDDSTDRISLEEGVKLRHGSVQRLSRGAALEFKVHLLWVGGAVAKGTDEGGELFCMEGSVLDRGVSEPGGEQKIMIQHIM